jgi:hypothetical protein
MNIEALTLSSLFLKRAPRHVATISLKSKGGYHGNEREKKK